MVKLKEIEKLSPEQRIKKLQELQKKKKEEIENAQKLIKESEEQLVKQKEIEQMIREVPLPKQRRVDVEDLWKEETLEEAVKKEKIPELTEEQRQYGTHLAETKKIEEITQNVYRMEQNIADKGYINPEEQEQFQANVYALRKKEEQYKKVGLDYEAKKSSRVQEEAERFLNIYHRSDADTQYRRAA